MTPISANLRCNEQIRISPIRVIGDANEQLGILPTAEALRMAQEKGLDLVEVQPNVRPPVCRIMDYGKFKYHQKKHQKKHHEQELKEVRLRPKTDTHDLEIKVKRSIDFLCKGDKVQFTMVFRGRERAHREIGIEHMQEIITELGEYAKVERAPMMDGKNMVMILAPGKLALEKQAQAAKEQAARHPERREMTRPDGSVQVDDRTAPPPASNMPPITLPGSGS